MKKLPAFVKVLILLAAFVGIAFCIRFADQVVAKTQDTASMATYQVA